MLRISKNESLIGKKFNSLSVISYVGIRNGKRVWLCKCDCGNELEVTTGTLNSSGKKSCGCLSKINLIGQKFGRLTVISQAESNNKKVRRWWCSCDCGNEISVITGSLTNGNTKSCGCLNKEHIARLGSRQRFPEGSLTKTLFSGIKAAAAVRKIIFNITFEYVWDLFLKQNKKCALSNLPIQFGTIRRKIETTASLDRIDSSKGYIEGNVQWVHKKINLMKNNIREDEFIMYCREVSKFNE